MLPLQPMRLSCDGNAVQSRRGGERRGAELDKNSRSLRQQAIGRIDRIDRCKWTGMVFQQRLQYAATQLLDNHP